MSGSGIHDIKDSTIHTLTQLLQAKEKELSDIRRKYEILRERLNDEDRRKSCILDACTQTLETDVIDSLGSLESVCSDTEFEQHLNKNKELHLNNINPYTYKSINDNSAEEKLAGVSNIDSTLVKNDLTGCDLKDVALEDVQVKIGEIGKLRKTGEDENTFWNFNRLSFKIKKKGDMTQKGSVRYRWPRRKKRSQKCDPARFTDEEHSSEETETEFTTTNETSLSEPSHRSDRDRSTTMQPLKSGHEQSCPEGDSGCSFSSSYNDNEIDCHEMNRRVRSNSYPEINNRKNYKARTDHHTGNANIHSNNQDPNNIVPDRGLIVVNAPSTRRLQEPNASNIIFKETDMHQSKPDSMEKYSYTMADGDLNESYV